MQERYENVVGDIALAAGQLAYLGPFPSRYRTRALAWWQRLLSSRHSTGSQSPGAIGVGGAFGDGGEGGVGDDGGLPTVMCSRDFSLSTTLGTAVRVSEWVAQGLPSDRASVDNAVMMQIGMAMVRNRISAPSSSGAGGGADGGGGGAGKWPLLIDPQGQASRWIKRKHAHAQSTTAAAAAAGVGAGGGPSNRRDSTESQQSTDSGSEASAGDAGSLSLAAQKLRVVRMGDRAFVRTLENCLMFGDALLVERVGNRVRLAF